jgi:hypothetical protein
MEVVVCLLAYICDIKVTQKVQSEGLKYKPFCKLDSVVSYGGKR